MNSRTPRRFLADELAAAAAAYQAAAIIPHCVECSKPCCRLDPLVLELDWKQLRALWRIEESRAAFDRQLCSGKGPAEIGPGMGSTTPMAKSAAVGPEFLVGHSTNKEFAFLVTLSVRKAAGTATVSKRKLRDR